MREEPRHALTLAAASSVALYRGRMRDALDYAQQARDIDPRNAAVLNYLAEAYEAAGFYEASAEVYAQCISLNPVIMDPYVYGALPLVRLGKFGEAIDRVRLFRAFDPSSIHIVGIEAYALTRQGEPAVAEAMLIKSRNELGNRFAGDAVLAFRYSYLDYALALAQLRQGRESFGREVVSRLGAVSRRTLDDVILLTAALDLPKAAIENIQTNPHYRNYRYLVSEPGLKPLYDEPEFRNLLSQTYSEWRLLLAEYGDTLPVRPPTLPSPDEFVAARFRKLQLGTTVTSKKLSPDLSSDRTTIYQSRLRRDTY